ncbi:MAG: AI-2E family transporter [Verrucomicrobiales bacterium]
MPQPEASPTRASPFTGSLRALVGMAAAILVLGAVKLAADFLIPVMLGFFIAVLSFPIMRFLQSKRVPHWLALFLTLVFDLSVLIGIAFLGASLFQDFQAKWTSFYAIRLRDLSIQGVAWAETTLSGAGISGFRESFNEFINVDAILELASDNVGSVLSGVTATLKLIILVLLLVGFMLAEGSSFARKLPSVRAAGGPDFGALTRVTGDVQKYLGIKTFVSAATGLCAWALCAGTGLDFALLWGIVAFALNFIPAIGSIVAAIPPMLLALVQNGFGHFALIGAGYLLINTIWGNIIEPTLQGRRFGIATIVVVLSVLFWGWLLGVAGMFLAVPLTMLVKVALDMSPELRWLSALLETEKAVPAVAQAIVDKVTGADETPHLPDGNTDPGKPG